MNQHQLKNEIENLKHQISTISQFLKKLPKEDIRVISSGHFTKWFVEKDGVTTYLSKKEKTYAYSLVKAKYLRAKLTDLTIQLKALQQTESKFRTANHADKLLSKTLYKVLINSIVPDSKSISSNEWQHQPYESNPLYPEQLVHNTLSGILVRSKSEEKIANMLYSLNIPFRYEAALHFPNQIYYPDFTILHPQTNQIFYWEHYGKMDNKSYRSNTFNKMAIFAENGIIPGITLITTYETLMNPLSTLTVEDIIKHYFL